MLKKLYQKNGIVFIFNDDDLVINNNIDLCYSIINKYDKNKTYIEYKKDYLIKKGFIYPHLS